MPSFSAPLSTAPDRATPHTAEKPMPLTSITSIIIAGQRSAPAALESVAQHAAPGLHTPSPVFLINT